MSIKLMQGFDSMGNDQDFRTQGWVYPPGSLGQIGIMVPSSTGVPGRALKTLSGTINGTSVNTDATVSQGVSGDYALGYYNTGITVNQAWTAGGFALGCSAKFWQSPNVLNPIRRQMGYDPQNNVYYTIMGSAVYVSPDLTNWAPAKAQPPGVSTGWGNTFSYMGNGIMMFCPVVASTAMTVYWSNNGGQTWNAQTIGTLPSAAQYYCMGQATGNATYPMMINIGGSSSTAVNGIYVGTLGGTFVLAKNLTQGYQGSTGVIGTPGITASGLLYHISNGAVSSALNTTDISQAANWTVTTGFDGSMYDMQYYPKANKWICASGANGFIYSLVNPGTTANPLAPTSGTSTTITLAGGAATTYSMQVMVTNGGNNCVVIGGSGSNGSSMYAYCTDGATWQTKFTVQPNNNVAYTGFTLAGNQASFYSGCVGQNGRIVKIGNAASSTASTYVASSPDGVSNWVVNYANDANAAGSTGGYSGIGVRASKAAIANNTTWLQAGGAANLNASTPSGGTSTISTYVGTSISPAQTAVVSTNPLTHYYEIVATAIAGTTNSFNTVFYIDGVAMGAATAIAFATGTTDTTSILLINLPRSQNLTNIDDMYFILQDGTNTQAPLTAWNIQAPALTSDAQAQWTKSGTAASNAVTVNTPLATAGGYVSTSVDGAKDEYSTAGVLANSKVLAVQNETNFMAQTGTPSCSLGILSGTTEVDGTTVNATTLGYTRSTILAEKDPNGNVAWTVASANAAKVVVNKIS